MIAVAAEGEREVQITRKSERRGLAVGDCHQRTVLTGMHTRGEMEIDGCVRRELVMYKGRKKAIVRNNCVERHTHEISTEDEEPVLLVFGEGTLANDARRMPRLESDRRKRYG